jgi:alanyl aminopeptidase
VRRYLKRHEFGSATAEDFFAALADKDPEIAQAFASFVEQPGVPMVSMALNCANNSTPPAITLQQQRYLPSGHNIGHIGSQQWIVPVCLRYEGQTSAQPFCTLLREKEATITLPDASACPKWVLPNPAGTGYYLSNIDQALLPQQDLPSPEVVALGADLSLMARSGSIPLAPLLAFAARYADDARPDVAKAAVKAAKALHPAWLNANAHARHSAWIQRHFGQRARTLGWQPNKNDTDAQSQLREDLLPLAAQVGADPVLRKQARTLALQWLHHTGETELGTMLPHILKTAAFNADPTVFNAFVTAAAKTRNNRDREAIFSALGMVTNPALRTQAFQLLLSGRFDTREAVSMLSVASEQAENRTAMLQFVRQNYVAILAKMPDAYGSRLPNLGRGLCTKPERDAFLAFFEPRVAKYPGGARNLAQTLENINICVATGELQMAGGKLYSSKLLRGQRQQ